MPTVARHIPIEAITSAYDQHKSVWSAGKSLGIDGRAVSTRLKEINYPTQAENFFSPAEEEKVRAYYENSTFATFDLNALAVEMGRLRTSVCMVAKRMGLTKQGRSTKKIVESGRAGGKGKWQRNPHPRGTLGMKHSDATKQKMSEASLRSWVTQKTFGIGNASPENLAAASKRLTEARRALPAHKQHTRAAGAHRADLDGVYFRSSWEANYARYLNLLKKMNIVESWEFEPETFWFEGVRRGAVSYLPDFRVIYRNDPKPEYVEIKGWVVAKDKTKWRRLAKYHPHIKLVVIKEKEYYALKNKWASAIPNWEYAKGKWSNRQPGGYR